MHSSSVGNIPLYMLTSLFIPHETQLAPPTLSDQINTSSFFFSVFAPSWLYSLMYDVVLLQTGNAALDGCVLFFLRGRQLEPGQWWNEVLVAAGDVTKTAQASEINEPPNGEYYLLTSHWSFSRFQFHPVLFFIDLLILISALMSTCRGHTDWLSSCSDCLWFY